MDIPNEEVQVDQSTQDIDPSKVEVDQSEEIPNEEVSIDNSQTANDHNSFGQQVMTGIEGAARGLTAGLSDAAFKGARSLAEKYSNDPDFWAPKIEDVTARKEENPILSKTAELGGMGAGFMTGAGAPGLISNTAKGAADIAGLGRVGSAALKGAIESGMIQGGDEISQAILGQKGSDPSKAVASAIALGGVLGVPVGIAGKAANALAETQMAEKGAKLLGEFGTRWTERQSPKFLGEAAKTAGGELADRLHGNLPNMSEQAIKKGADAIGGTLGGLYDGIGGAAGGAILTDKFIAPLLSKYLSSPLTKLSTNAVSAAVKVLGEGDTNALYKTLDYVKNIDKGAKAIDSGIEGLFKPGRKLLIDETIPDKDKKKLGDWIDNGGINQELQSDTPEPEYAEGGQVNPNSQPKNPIADHFPAQDMLMNAAKGRVSQYLTSLKPNKNAPRLPFDKALSTTNQERSYDKALGLAVKPLTILHDVKNGTLSVEKLRHFTQMYPELYNHLSEKMTNQMVKNQLSDQKPDYKTRQSMSLFLCKPLDSTMTPQSIQAAQMTYIPQQPPQQLGMPQGKTKKGTSTLGKSNKSYQTASQAAESDTTSRE
jgi:hypothetical protein